MNDLEYKLDGDRLEITVPRKGRKPLTESYALSRHAGGFILQKDDNERHIVAGGECTCAAFRFGKNGCKHRRSLVALYREGKIK